MRKALIAAVLLLTATAYATPASDATKMAEGDCAKARAANKTCVLDMGNEKIIGDKPVDSGTKVDVIGFTQATSLIHIRRDFIPEIIKTAEDL